MIRGLAIAALMLVLPGVAVAADRPLAPVDTSAPVVSGDRVVFGQSSGKRSVVLSSESLAGGARTVLGRLQPDGCRGSLSDWTLAGGPAGIGFRLAAQGRCERLFGGPAANPLLPIGGPARQGPVDVAHPVLSVAGGLLTIDLARNRLLLHTRDGKTSTIPVPRDADLTNLDASGQTIAYPRASRVGNLGSVELRDLATGRTRRFAPGPLKDLAVEGLGLGPDGAVVVAADDRLVGYGAPNAGRLRIVARGRTAVAVQTAGGRIAMALEAPPISLSSGRVVVVRVPAGRGPARTEYRSPPLTTVGESLSFDGRWLAWAGGGCQVLSDTAAPSSPAVLPAGPCVRTEARGRVASLRRGEHAFRARVRCLTGPGGRCKVRLWVIDGKGRALASGLRRIRAARTAHVSLAIHGRTRLRRARRAKDAIGLLVGMIDPDGKARGDGVYIITQSEGVRNDVTD